MKNGVTLLVLVVAISVMFVIISSASVIGINSINQANYEEYKSMIKRVSDDINSYYLTNKELPINNEIISVDSLGMDFSNNVKNNKDENDIFYIVNIDKLNNQTITNGRGTLQNKDVFLIAKNSNNLYYLKGFRFNDKINYSLRNEENVTSVTADTIEKYVKTGLILHYDGINNTGTSHSTTTNIWKDLSGNNNNATLQTFNYTTSSGWNSNYLKFDGTDFLDLALTMSNVYTVEFVAIARNNAYNGIFAVRDANYKSYALGVHASNLLVYNTAISTGNNYIAQALNYSSPASYSIVFNGSTTPKVRKVYQNTQSKTVVYAGGGETTDFSNYTNFVIGKCMYGNLYGDIYSVRIYNRELTLSEITQNYQVDVERFGI